MTKKEKQPETLSVTTSLEKIVPKFCTGIQAGLLNNNNIVLTLIYSEAKTENDIDPTHSIIDRVVIDKEHSKHLAELLNKINNYNA